MYLSIGFQFVCQFISAVPTYENDLAHIIFDSTQARSPFAQTEYMNKEKKKSHRSNTFWELLFSIFLRVFYTGDRVNETDQKPKTANNAEKSKGPTSEEKL